MTLWRVLAAAAILGAVLTLTSPANASACPDSVTYDPTPGLAGGSSQNCSNAKADVTAVTVDFLAVGGAVGVVALNALRKGNQFRHHERDPLRKWGPGQQTHPKEWNDSVQLARELGVEVIIYQDEVALKYIPAPSPGNPGQICLYQDASIGAMRHEMRHLLDDYLQGWGGFQQFNDPLHAFQMEYRGYMEEIDYAESMGDRDSVAKLQQFIEEERRYYLGEE